MKTFVFLIAIFQVVSNNLQAQTKSAHLDLAIVNSGIGDLNTDEIGKLHNEALEYIFSKLSASGKPMGRSAYLEQHNQAFTEFMHTENLEVRVNFDGELEQFLKESLAASICGTCGNLSMEAAAFGCRLDQCMQDFIEEKISLGEFVDKTEGLRLSAAKLKSEADRKLCGMSASIAKHSFQYWSVNFEKYLNLLHGMFPAADEDTGVYSWTSSQVGNTPLSRIYKINWRMVGLSDAYGAWNWGRFGAIAGGGAGTVALGLAGAAWQSASSLVTQAAVKQLTH